MQPFLLAGLVQFDDTVAAAASESGLACHEAPCTLVVPSEGRVLSFESNASVSGVEISGGALTLHCISSGDAVPELQLSELSGEVHVTGCAVTKCDRVSGTLRAEWDQQATCTDFSGTFVSLGDSKAHVSGSGTLMSGGEGATTVVGTKWSISGTGPVNFTGVDDLQFDGGTAGIKVLDWAWLHCPMVTIWEFANEAPRTDFVDQTIEVVGGWPEGSTLVGCTVSGTLGYAPVIRGSVVFAAEHTYGPIVSVVEDSELNGDIRADGRIFLNGVRGDISVSTHTTFVNTYAGSGELIIDGPHTVLCPKCGRVVPYEDSMTVAETDVFIERDIAHDLDLNGHVALLGAPGSRRSRRDSIDVDGTTTVLPGNSAHTITGGDVTLVENITLSNALTLNSVNFNFSIFKVTTNNAFIIQKSNVYALQDGQSCVILNDGGNIQLSESAVFGYLELSAASGATNTDATVSVVTTEHAGGIMVGDTASNTPIEEFTFCYLTWSGDSAVTMQYVYNFDLEVDVSTSTILGDTICFYSGDEEAVQNDANQCSQQSFPNKQILMTSGGTACDSVTTTTVTTTTTTTIVTTTTTTTVTTAPTTTAPPTTAPATTSTASTTTTTPRPTAKSSSSSGLSDSEIAGIVVGSVIGAAVLITSIVAFMRRTQRSNFGRDYESLPKGPPNEN
jgi:hypothetical protein